MKTTILVDVKNVELDVEKTVYPAIRRARESGISVEEVDSMKTAKDRLLELGPRGALVSALTTRRLLAVARDFCPIRLTFDQNEELKLPLLACMPTVNHQKLYIAGDVGAHVEADVYTRYCWAIMAIELSRRLQLHKHQPIVGIDSIGEEVHKLDPESRQLYDLLLEGSDAKIRPAEPKDVWSAEIDVLCFRDARRGNEFLKDSEAAALALRRVTKDYFLTTLLTKAAGAFSKPVFRRVGEHLSEGRFSGALLAGAGPQTFLKIHGRSDEEMFFGGIMRAAKYVNDGTAASVQDALLQNLRTYHPDWLEEDD